MSIITLDEAKEQLGIALFDTSMDDELQPYVDSITGAVEEYLHHLIELRDVTDEIELYGVRCFTGRPQKFRLWSRPVASLTSVQSWDGATTWDVSSMRVSAAGVVRVMAGPPVHGLAEVTYQAGCAAEDVPARYKQGALVILQHTWETQRGAGAVSAGVLGPEEVHMRAGSTFTVPNKAKEWLGAPWPVVG